jgi:hypothetical protein
MEDAEEFLLAGKRPVAGRLAEIPGHSRLLRGIRNLLGATVCSEVRGRERRR